MKKYPKVSIIIPVYKVTPYFYEAVEKCLELNYPNFDILIGVDQDIQIRFKDRRIKILRTNRSRTGPAEKRDIGIFKSNAQYIAFLDDDSYPHKDWLIEAVKILRLNQDITAVGGPGLTPPFDSFSQQITGAILSSFSGTGPYTYRFIQQNPRLVDDYPAYNLIVERKSLLEVSGFKNKFYGGEDTALCIKLINVGKKILYHPDVVVFHHRRSFPLEYLKQVGNVGLHRGYFVKKYPQTSLRISYFIPSLAILLSLMSLFLPPILLLFLVISTYLFIFLDSKRSSPLIIALILPLCIYLSHLSYAYNFTNGLLFTKYLEK